MTFHVGQKVVCVDGTTPALRQWSARLVKPTEGAIYTITAARIYPWEQVLSLQLAELPTQSEDGRRVWYQAKRFRPLVERKTSIEIFQKIRKDVEQSVPVKEASNV